MSRSGVYSTIPSRLYPLSVLFEFYLFEIIRTQEIKLSLQLGKRDIDDERDDEEPPDEVKVITSLLFGYLYFICLNLFATLESS